MVGHPGVPWIALAVALIARLHRLGHQSFWVDEFFTLRAIRHVREVDASHLMQDLHGPLYTAMGALFAGLLPGENLRLISALAGAAAVLPLHAWAKRVAGKETAALVALMGALSPFGVWYGQELRNYSFVLLFSACCLLALERMREGNPGLGGFGAFVISAWLGLLANLTFFLFLAGAGLATVIAASGRRLRISGWMGAAAIVVFVLSLPWISTFIHDMEPQRLVVENPVWDEAPLRGETTFSPLAIPYTFYSLLGGFSLGPSLADLHRNTGEALKHNLPILLTAGSVFAASGLFGLLGMDGRRRLEIAIVMFIVLGLASFLAIKNFKVYNVRYVSMLWPLVLLIVARGVVVAKPRWLGKGLGVGILLLFAFALGQHYWNPAYGKEDLRTAAHEVELMAEPGSTVLVGVAADPFRYYFEGSNPVLALWPGMGSAQIRSRLENVNGEVILVSARDWEWGGEQSLLASFKNHRVKKSATLQGVRIYTLHKLR